MLVATDRCIEYTALSIGCIARLALLTALGVTARLTARPGCMARRTLRGTSNLEKKPTMAPYVTNQPARTLYLSQGPWVENRWARYLTHEAGSPRASPRSLRAASRAFDHGMTAGFPQDVPAVLARQRVITTAEEPGARCRLRRQACCWPAEPREPDSSWSPRLDRRQLGAVRYCSSKRCPIIIFWISPVPSPIRSMGASR